MSSVAHKIPNPQTVWEPSTVSEVKILALVDCGLLRSKAEVEWKASTSEAFLTEDDKE
jgi:hypothetical protein